MRKQTSAHTSREQLLYSRAEPSTTEQQSLGPDYSIFAKHCKTFVLPFEKGRFTSFGKQDEIGLNRFPRLARYGSFQFLQQQVLETSTSQTRLLKATYAGPASETASPQLLAYLTTADSRGFVWRSPSQRKRLRGFVRAEICSDLPQTCTSS